MSVLRNLEEMLGRVTPGIWGFWPALGTQKSRVMVMVDYPPLIGEFNDYHDAEFVAYTHRHLPLLIEAVECLAKMKPELVLQIESKHGPKAASQYPEIARAEEILKQLKG